MARRLLPYSLAGVLLALAACQPTPQSPANSADARGDRDFALVSSAGHDHLLIAASLQQHARQVACDKGLAQNLLLALLSKEYQSLDPGIQEKLADSDTAERDKSLGIASMKPSTAQALIDTHHLNVPERSSRPQLVHRLAFDDTFDVDLAAWLLQDAKNAGLVDKAAFVVGYTQPSSAWRDYTGPKWNTTEKYPDKPFSLDPRDLPRESLHDRARDYDRIVAELAAANDWVSLPQSVQTSVEHSHGVNHLTLPYAPSALPITCRSVAAATPTTAPPPPSSPASGPFAALVGHWAENDGQGNDDVTVYPDGKIVVVSVQSATACGGPLSRAEGGRLMFSASLSCSLYGAVTLPVSVSGDGTTLTVYGSRVGGNDTTFARTGAPGPAPPLPPGPRANSAISLLAGHWTGTGDGGPDTLTIAADGTFTSTNFGGPNCPGRTEALSDGSYRLDFAGVCGAAMFLAYVSGTNSLAAVDGNGPGNDETFRKG